VIQLTLEPIDTQLALRHVQSPQAGAVVTFLGTTREFTGGRQTVRLCYEGYREMAERKLGELEQQARARWPLVGCALVHRLGAVELGEASVLVAVSTPHRRDAFEAASWLMDRIKTEVPIWKQEHWADGSQSWIHPGASDLDGPTVPCQPDAAAPPKGQGSSPQDVCR
jgi:molybdopterin synthase catalytic subunit